MGKKILMGWVLFLSLDFSLYATGVETCSQMIRRPQQQSGMSEDTLIFGDYGWQGSTEATCRYLITYFMCANMENDRFLTAIKKPSWRRKISINERGAAKYCYVEDNNFGFFQVILSSMISPPTAMVLYSRWD